MSTETASRWDNDGSKEGGGRQADPSLYTIVADKPNICRLVNASGYIKTWESWIVGDDNKKLPYVIGREYFDEKTGMVVKEWSPLLKIIGNPETYYRGGLLETIKGDDGGKKAVWEKDPEVFNIIFKNNDLMTDQGSWQAKKTYYWELIPRGNSCDMDKETGELFNWAVDNKHTKYVKAGQQVFDAINALRAVNGDPSGYDISLTKTGQGRNNTKYGALKPDTQQNERLRAIVKQGALSSEEKAYARVNLMELTKVTDADTIITRLSNTIRRLDELTGSNFYETLTAMLPNRPAASTQTFRTSAVNSTPPAQPKAAAHEDFDDSAVPTGEPEAPAEPTVGRRRMKAASTDTVVCGKCKTTIDANVEVCPSCGEQNLTPCDACGKKFSQFKTKCPHCGQDYSM